MVFTLANIISLSRVALAVAFALSHSPTRQVLLIVAAALTDFLDGFVARHFNQRSRLGEILDPTTDKMFVATAIGTMLVRGRLSIASALLLLIRDVYNALAFIVIRVQHMPIRLKARMSGKVVTVLQMTTLVVFLL